MEEELFERLAEIADVVIGEGAFSPGMAVWVGRREVAHLDGDGRLDVRLTKSVIRERRADLRADPRVSLRPGTSDWMQVGVVRQDLDFVVQLVEDAVVANRPSAAPGLPPTGAELERRRRFH